MSNFNISQFTQQVCDYQTNLMTSFIQKNTKLLNLEVRKATKLQTSEYKNKLSLQENRLRPRVYT